MKILIVGAGRMGQIRAAAALAAGAQQLYFVESDPATAAHFSQVHPSAVRLVAVPENRLGIDAAFVCVPPADHFAAVRACIGLGVPVLVEKPFTNSQEQAASLLQQAHLARTPVFVGYHNRARRSVQKLRHVLASQDVIGFSVDWIATPYAKSWWGDRARGGGGFCEQACHVLDLVRFSIGDITHSDVCAVRREGSNETVTAWLRTGPDTAGTILYSSHATARRIEFRVFTRDSSYTLRDWDLDLVVNGEVDERGAAGPDRMDIFTVETAEFLRSISEGCTTYLATMQDAMAAERIALDTAQPSRDDAYARAA